MSKPSQRSPERKLQVVLSVLCGEVSVAGRDPRHHGVGQFEWCAGEPAAHGRGGGEEPLRRQQALPPRAAGALLLEGELDAAVGVAARHDSRHHVVGFAALLAAHAGCRSGDHGRGGQDDQRRPPQRPQRCWRVVMAIGRCSSGRARRFVGLRR